MAEAQAGSLVTQAEYARLRGWSKQYVGQLVARGRLTLTGGMVDPQVAGAEIARTADPARSSGLRGERRSPGEGGSDQAPAPPSGSFVRARTVREHFRAMREKLDYEVATGALLPRTDVEQACFDAGRITRDEVLHAAHLAAEAVVALPTPLGVQQVTDAIQAAIEAGLARASERIEGEAALFDRGGLGARTAGS